MTRTYLRCPLAGAVSRKRNGSWQRCQATPRLGLYVHRVAGEGADTVRVDGTVNLCDMIRIEGDYRYVIPPIQTRQPLQRGRHAHRGTATDRFAGFAPTRAACAVCYVG